MNIFSLIFTVLLLTYAGCSKISSSADIPAVSGFELDKYMGKWYEIARLPNFFQRDMNDVHAVYSLNDNGSAAVLNQGYKNGRLKSISGTIYPAGDPDTGELKVSFFPGIYSPYRIIKIAPDYRYSAVCGKSKDLLWILARKKEIPTNDLDVIRKFLDENGFDTDKLIFSSRK